MPSDSAPVAAADLQAAGDALPRPHAHCHWLWPGRLLAGAHPAADGRLESLEAAGVTHFVDLSGGRDYGPARALRLAHPITDFGLPTAAGMRAVLDDMDAALAAGGLVYLHCRAGIGRTGTVAGCWLVERGCSPPQALALLQHKWQANASSAWAARVPETAAQRDFVLRWQVGDGACG